MEKQIIEYADKELISIQAVMLSQKDHSKIRFELSTFKGLNFIHIDADSIHAEISEPQFSDIEKLESLGWSFI